MATVWETAKTMEAEGMAFYTKLGSETPNPEIAGIFKFLASEEEKHLAFFDALSKGKSYTGELESDVISQTKSIFEGFKIKSAVPAFAKDAAVAYQKAADLEQKAVEFYESLLTETTDDSDAEALEIIIEEEEKHARIMESLVDFVRTPGEYLENAEFNNLDDEF